jgi:hypothetical protein
MKVSIFYFAVNDKFPIDIAYRQFKKYLKDDFDFILLNDAADTQIEHSINTIASANNIKSVRVPQHIHNSGPQDPSFAYSTSLNWALHEYAAQNDFEIIVLMHSDVFPVCDVSIVDILGEYIIASTTEFRIRDNVGITYLYPAFTIINMKKLSNPQVLDFGTEPGLDVGGKTYEFIKNFSNQVKFINNHQIEYFIAILENDPAAEYYKADLTICRSHGLSAGWVAEGFYHYMAGSQWNSSNPIFAAGHKKRMDLFLNYFY